MTTYLAYAAGGKEFLVEKSLKAEGFDVWCGKKVDFIRKGKNRRAEPEENPKLPNYIFISLTDEEWQRLRKTHIKHLSSKMYELRRDDEDQLGHFKAIVDNDFQAGRRIAERNDPELIAQFRKGQALTDLRGRFGDAALTFRRMVERGRGFPEIQAETEMMGRVVSVYLDPLDVKAEE